MIFWALHVLNLKTRWAGPSTAKSSDCLGLECSGSSPWRLGSRKARYLLSHSNPGVAYVGVLSYVLQICHSNHRQVCGMRLQACSLTYRPCTRQLPALAALEQSSDLSSYQAVQRAGFHQAFARSSNPPCALPHRAVMDTLAEGRRQAMGSAFLSRCILNSFPDNTHFP